MGILVPKSHPTLINTPNSVKIWTRATETPVNAPQYKVTVRPIEATNTDAVVPGSVTNKTINCLKADASSSKGQSSNEHKGQSSTEGSYEGKVQSSIRGVVVSYEHKQQGEMKMQSNGHDESGFDNIKYYHLKNLSKNLLVRATKFFLNGEVCYLIPAKVVLDHASQEDEGQNSAPTEQDEIEVTVDSGEDTSKETTAKTTGKATTVGSSVKKDQITNVKSKIKRSNLPSTTVLRVNKIVCPGSQQDLDLPANTSSVPVTQMGYKWHDFVPPKSSAPTCYPGFEILESRATECQEELSFTKNRATREHPKFTYSSIQRFKRNRNGLPKIRVSRLISKGETSKLMGQMSDQRSKDENNGSNTEDKNEGDFKISSSRKGRKG